MKIAFYFNLVVYLTVIALYINETVIGAISQFFLGLFQLVFAIKLSFTFNLAIQKTKKHLNYYWRSILIWIALVIIMIILPEDKYASMVIVFGLSMIIGLYFVIITYLIYRNSF
ncbi:MAG: hypothetical protein EVB11_07795 [Winogradskyella sp.]|nr:MAG: hypothetical protein EVB11_07795 [Winogradskyella sp.]